MDGIPIREAAQRLGITVESLRKRAQRGTITAYKVDGEWFIALSDEQDQARDGRQDGGQDGGQDSSSATTALVEQLSFMQRELERRDLEVERLTGMLAESQRTVRLLLPASAGQEQDGGLFVASSQPSHRTAEDDPSPQSAPVAPEGAQREIDPLQRVPPRRSWLARLLGWEE